MQARLKDLFAKWIAPETLTKDQICDQMVLEQFLGMLNTDLQVWVREHTPRSSAEAADLVETFVTARPSRRKYFLGPPQHDWRRPYQAAQQEPEKTSTGKPAGDSGRVVKLSYSPNSPSVSSTPARTPRGMICHGCGQQGHIRPNCTEKKMSDSRLCYLPGPNKHTHMTCADVIVPVKVKGKTLQADSGSSHSFILKSCLESDFQPRGKIKVCCIHGDESEHQTGEVLCEIRGQKYLLTMGVLDKGPYPVILGQDVPVLVDLLQTVTVNAYVTTRAQTTEKANDLWSELPYDCCPGGKGKKSKAERRREKVTGTSVQESMPSPPLEHNEVLVEDFAKLQLEDPTLSSCFSAVKNPDEAREALEEGNTCFVKNNEKLYRVAVDTEQLVVPKVLRAEVLHLGHSIPWAGHLGMEKTENRILNRFYWPGFHKDIAEYCRSCPECQLSARSKRGLKVPLISLPIIDVPFSRIAMDVVGPLERSRAGHRYILVICDYATRYPEAFPLRNTKARQVANCLIQLLSRVGVPKEILTDQGSNFTSKSLRQVYYGGYAPRHRPVVTCCNHFQDGLHDGVSHGVSSYLPAADGQYFHLAGVEYIHSVDCLFSII